MDPDWIWVGHILADGFGPFGPSGNVIGGLWNGPKRPNYGLNGVGLAISGPRAPKLVDPGGSRLDLGGTHPG